VFYRKVHALSGNFNALFLTDVLEDALNKLTQSTLKDPLAFLAKLQAEEDAEYAQFFKAELPSIATGFPVPDDVDRELIFKSPNFCHTGRLPADTRHRGILTESSKVGVETFDMCVYKSEADRTENPSEFMRLVCDDNTRQDCPISVGMDYKDYFYVNEKEGWKKLLIPNDAEKAAYGTVKPRLQGVLAICMVGCSWGSCLDGRLAFGTFERGESEMEVNGIKVVNFTNAFPCRYLKHEKGHKFRSNSDGRFEIRARTLEPSGSLRFSTIAVW
jgi:hypothetical protein